MAVAVVGAVATRTGPRVRTFRKCPNKAAVLPMTCCDWKCNWPWSIHRLVVARVVAPVVLPRTVVAAVTITMPTWIDPGVRRRVVAIIAVAAVVDRIVMAVAAVEEVA